MLSKKSPREVSASPDPELAAAPLAAADPSATADLGASIAEHAVRLAHLYLERIRMSDPAGEHSFATQDKSRAESLCKWATQAAQSTNDAGHDVLQPRLDQLRTELDSLQLVRGAGNGRWPCPGRRNTAGSAGCRPGQR